MTTTIQPARKRKKTSPIAGPSLLAGPFGHSGSGAVTQLLTDRQRQQLAAVAASLRLPSGTSLYEQQSQAGSIWIVDSGVVKSWRILADGKRQVTAFLFAGDLFGLAENGHYVNSTKAVTAVTLYRIAVDVLTDILRRDPELEFQFLCKMAHELRELQRRSIIVGRRDAPGRLAMFIAMLAREQTGTDVTSHTIPVPMSRMDIAEFLDLTPEAVSRATRRLKTDGIAIFQNRHAVRIVDRDRFEQLVGSV